MKPIKESALKIRDYVVRNADMMIEDLLDITSHPSVRSAPEPGAPYGPDCAECLKYCAGLFARDGWRTEIYPDSGYAIARFRDPVPGEEYLGVFCHSDVVPADEERWTVCRPFEPILRDGILYGRGILDNKSSIAIMLSVFRGLRELGINPKRNIVVFIGSNEESGMGDIRRFVAEQPLPAVSIVPDSSFPVSFGERGVCRVDVTAGKMQDVLSVSGGSAYNTVLGVLECSVRDRDGFAEWIEGREYVTVIDKKDGVVKFSVAGVSCHAGHPDRGDTALRRLAFMLRECPCICESDRELFGLVAKDLSDVYGQALGLEATDPDLGRLMAANGIVRTESDGRLMFTLDIRYGKIPGYAAVIAKLEAFYAARGWSVRRVSGSDALVIPRDDERGLGIISFYEELTGTTGAKPYYMHGGTYAKYLPNPYATGVSLGEFRSGLGMAEGHGKVHEPDECLGVDAYTTGAGILAAIVVAQTE